MMKPLILDADGVFMNEMPYWKTALATALDLHGLAAAETPWAALAEACLSRRRLQAITKRRGCNSNWDFAAVLARALEVDDTRRTVGRALSQRDTATAAAALERGMEAQWRGSAAGTHPVSGFGIDREGAYFQRVVDRFQAVFDRERKIGWTFARQALAASPEQTGALLADFRRRGFTLCVCTSRTRTETLGPMREFGIVDYFDSGRIVTHDDVMEGERRTGVAPLGKPHWFPLAVAVWGMERAVAAVETNERLEDLVAGDRLVYVGDAPADYQAAGALRGLGALVAYAHIDSGITPEDVLGQILADSMTLGVAPDLAGVAALLEEVDA